MIPDRCWMSVPSHNRHWSESVMAARSESPIVDQCSQRRDTRVRTVDLVDVNWFVLLNRAPDHFASHQFATRDLSLLQWNRKVNILVRQNVPFWEITTCVHSADEGVKIRDLLLRGIALLRSRSATHLLRLVKCLEPSINLVGKRAVRTDLHSIRLDVDVAFEGSCPFC